MPPTTTRTKAKPAVSEDYEEVVNEADEYEEVEGGLDFPPTHDFNDDPEIIGVFVGSETKDIKGKQRTIHSFEVNGVLTNVWGAAILDSRLEGLEGAKVKAVRGNKVKTNTGNSCWEFKVYVAKSALAAS